MFQRCLICTEFSDGLDRLVKFVPSLAKSGLQQIIFYHSAPLWEEGEVARIDKDKINEAKQKLSEALRIIPKGVEVKIEVSSGDPVDSIPRILATHQIDVVILGTTIRSLLEEKIFGSTSTKIAKLTSVPILILRPQLISTYREEELDLRCQHLWRYLLIPYNDSKAARYCLDRIKHYAKSRAGNSFSKCLLLWVIEEVGRTEVIPEQKVKDAKEKLNSVKAELEALDLEVEAEVRRGNPVHEILQAGVNFDISAIAIGYDYPFSLISWTVPSIASDLLRSSWFPVLFFSPQK